MLLYPHFSGSRNKFVTRSIHLSAQQLTPFQNFWADFVDNCAIVCMRENPDFGQYDRECCIAVASVHVIAP